MTTDDVACSGCGALFIHKPGCRGRYVMDPFGNIWQRFNDVGYVRLVTAGRPAFKTVEELAAWVGPVATLRTPND